MLKYVSTTLFSSSQSLCEEHCLPSKHDGKIVLGDEFTPDGCRLWDKDTLTKMDKDRFRQDLGDVIETYGEVADRLGMQIKLD